MHRSIGSFVLLAALAAAVRLVAACTETPDYFPPCVDPNAPACAPYDAGVDADAAITADAEAGD